MNKGIRTRLIIHNILKNIKTKSINFDEAFINNISGVSISESDKKFIQNIVLNSMRNYMVIEKIIENLAKKVNVNSDAYFLLLSSITQLFFLKIKAHAVVDSTVELTKLKNIHTSTNFINAFLRNFMRKINHFKKIKREFNLLPVWFFEKTKNWKQDIKEQFLTNIAQEPQLHIVFKSKNDLNHFLEYGYKTTEKSLAIHKSISFNRIPKYLEGLWWVQDYSSMMPLNLININDYNKIADVGSAPGGKLFQLLSKGADVVSYEKSYNRANILEKNLDRLKLHCNINIKDFLEIEEKEDFDLIVLDAPCSAVGTIRRNPEIFFKNKFPDFDNLIDIQTRLLEKAKKIIRKNGIIIYMVCSFLDEECVNQIDNFLKNNNNFRKTNFSNLSLLKVDKFLDDNSFFLTIPKNIKFNIPVDGYFAAKLERYD